MSTVQILVVGSVHGQFDALFARVSRLLVKHSFKALLCTGTFFGDDPNVLKPYIDKQKKVPLPTYFVSGDEDPASGSMGVISDSSDAGTELCENLFFLGRSGIKNIAGLNVAFLSGVYNANKYNASSEEELGDSTSLASFYRRDQVESLLKLAGTAAPVDVLLTNEFGRGFHVFTKLSDRLKESDMQSLGSPIVAKIALSFAPRYHFVSHDAHISVAPYRNQKPHKHISRCLSLARFGNKQKQKFIYACGTSPIASMDSVTLNEVPAGSTECPFTAKIRVRARENDPEKVAKRVKVGYSGDPFESMPIEPQNGFGRWDLTKRVPPPGYVCRRCSVPGHFINECPQGDSQDKGCPPPDYVCKICNEPGHFISDCPQKKPSTAPQGPCWFCLASPEVESHLIVSIGDSCYVAMPKGPMSDHHALIIPIEHVRSSTEVSPTTAMEIRKYKLALKNMLQSIGKSCLIYERNIRTRGASHLHLQVVSVPKSVAIGPEASSAFCETADRLFGMKFEQIDVLADIRDTCGDGEFISIEFGDGQRLLHTVCPDAGRVPLRAVRETIAMLLEQPQLADWKACKPSIQQEKQLVTSFKKSFESFDISN